MIQSSDSSPHAQFAPAMGLSAASHEKSLAPPRNAEEKKKEKKHSISTTYILLRK